MDPDGGRRRLALSPPNAAAYWLGGLIVLAIVALVAQRTLAPEDFSFLMRRSGRAFATGAIVAGLLLAASGVALARERVVSVEALAITPWGRTLALKTALAMVAAVLTLVHSWTGSGEHAVPLSPPAPCLPPLC
jgi:copper transport protein